MKTQQLHRLNYIKFMIYNILISENIICNGKKIFKNSVFVIMNQIIITGTKHVKNPN